LRCSRWPDGLFSIAGCRWFCSCRRFRLVCGWGWSLRWSSSIVGRSDARFIGREPRFCFSTRLFCGWSSASPEPVFWDRRSRHRLS
jgi:hypothetical protein